MRRQRPVNQLFLVRVLEGFRELPKDGEPLIDVELATPLAQQEIQPPPLPVVVEQQRRAEFAFLEIANLENAGVIDAFEDLEFPGRLTDQRLPGIDARREGVAVDPDAAADTGRDMRPFPILVVLALLNEGAQLIVADAAMLVGRPHAGFDHRPADDAAQLVRNQRAAGRDIPGPGEPRNDSIVVG